MAAYGGRHFLDPKIAKVTNSASSLECGIAIFSTGEAATSTYAGQISITLANGAGESATGRFTPIPGATIALAPGHAVITMGRISIDALSAPFAPGDVFRVSDEAMALMGAEPAIADGSLTVALPNGVLTKGSGFLDMFLARTCVTGE